MGDYSAFTASRSLAMVTVLSIGSCTASNAVTPVPRWHVAGGFLRDPDGRAVILRGANVAGSQKNAPYLGFQQAPDYHRMRDAWGMNAVRFILPWAAVEPSSGQYDDAYLDKVAERIGWAEQANLMVVIDMHQDVYGEGFVSGGGDGAPRWTCDASNYASFKPQSAWYLNVLTPQVTACFDHFWWSADLAQHYGEAWKRVAARLAAYDNVIGFDVMNEPYWGSAGISSFEPDVLEPFYEQIVGAVRSVAPDQIAFLEPSAFRNLGGSTHLMPFPFGDVVYAPHSYDRDAESNLGFDPTHGPALIANIAALQDEATSLGAALWIGEYGGRGTDPGIVSYMTAQYDGTGAVAAGAMYWSYDESNNYGLLNPDGTEKKVLLDVVVRPYPERVAGDPVSFAFDPVSSTFTFTFRPDASVQAPTVISVPDRVYPRGARVDCGGCTVAKSPGEVTLTTLPAGPMLVVTVRGM